MGLALLEVVTIDGPAGAGKSTVARKTALALNYGYLDTGAMYRAIAYGAVNRGISSSDFHRIQEYLREIILEMVFQVDGLTIKLDNIDITDEIRRPEMSRIASEYSAIKSIREFCSIRQRQIGEKGRIVAEGRDMGTVVFPDALWKFFLYASPMERARRRWLEQNARGYSAPYDEIHQDILDRDTQDSNREIAPLKPASDAYPIDCTELRVDEVVEIIVSQVNKKNMKNA